MSGSFTSLQLDTRAPEPLWRQLYSQLDDLLTSGAVQEGASLPPERDLAEALGVSRSTVKRSYDQLRHDKRVGGRGRAGSVVRTPPERVQPTLGQLKGFTEEMQELGKFATSTLLVCEVVTDRRMASIFQRPSHARFLHIERIRASDLGDDTKPTGSLVVVKAETIEEARQIADNDPYAKAGLFASVEVKAWNWVFNKPEA